jgi:hypothetical protein
MGNRRHTIQMNEDVKITGGGVAACCCAALLSKAGCRVAADATARGGSPVLMLSEQTQLLLRDVFASERLFDGAVKITKRIVAWGQDSKPVVLPHSGLVIAENALLNRLWPALNIEMSDGEMGHWNVVSSKRALPAVSHHEFGTRIASTNAVELNDTASSDACWVESTGNGWLFLLPCGEKMGSLISVGANAEALLAESHLVARQIKGLGMATGDFPAYPRIVTPLCGSGWIACGSAAVAFDPIAGEGAGNAVREGILASAVIAAANKGESEQDLFAHYSNRVLSGFLRHLQECCQFYTAVRGPWWEAELELMKQGIRWAHEELTSGSPSRFRLVGFELQRSRSE